MNQDPLVTINILTYNRKDELRYSLMKIYEQDYKNIEVIVVDNSSTDGTVEMLKKDFIHTTVVTLMKNIGVAGWNEGFKIAKADFVLVLDDDAFPDNGSIHSSIYEFQRNPQIACIAFNVIDKTTRQYLANNWLPKQKTNFKTYWPVFVGCAAMFRTDKINLIHFVSPEYFLYQHELPVSAEIYKAGYKILFNSEIKVYHQFKSGGYKVFNDVLLLKNNLRFMNEYFPPLLAFYHSLHLLTFYFSRSIRHFWFLRYLIISFSFRSSIIKKERISYSYYFWLKKLHIFDFRLSSKVIKTSNVKSSHPG